MANNFTDYARGLMVNDYPTTIYLSVHSAGPDGVGLNELNVARVQINLGAIDANNVREALEAKADFDIPGGQTVAYVGAFSAATGGDFLSETPLPAPKTYSEQSLFRVQNIAVDLNVVCDPNEVNSHTTTAQNLMVSALPDTVFISLHTSAPGQSGLNEYGTREETPLDLPGGGARAAARTLIDFEVDANTTISHVGVFDASETGNFIGSYELDPAAEFTDAGILRVVDLTLGLDLDCTVE